MRRMSERAKRLRDAREAALYTSGGQAAIALGVGASTYRAHENGQNDFGIVEAKLYGEKFGVRWEWLLDGSGPMLSEVSNTARRRADLLGALTREAATLDPEDIADLVRDAQRRRAARARGERAQKDPRK